MVEQQQRCCSRLSGTGGWVQAAMLLRLCNFSSLSPAECCCCDSDSGCVVLHTCCNTCMLFPMGATAQNMRAGPPVAFSRPKIVSLQSPCSESELSSPTVDIHGWWARRQAAARGVCLFVLSALHCVVRKVLLRMCAFGVQATCMASHIRCC